MVRDTWLQILSSAALLAQAIFILLIYGDRPFYIPGTRGTSVNKNCQNACRLGAYSLLWETYNKINRFKKYSMFNNKSLGENEAGKEGRDFEKEGYKSK